MISCHITFYKFKIFYDLELFNIKLISDVLPVRWMLLFHQILIACVWARPSHLRLKMKYPVYAGL